MIKTAIFLIRVRRNDIVYVFIYNEVQMRTIIGKFNKTFKILCGLNDL